MRTIESFLQSKPPVRLYHYTSAEGLMGIMTTGMIWASSAYHLNDSGEFRFAIGLIERALQARLNFETAERLRYCKEWIEQIRKLGSAMQVFIASFSEDGDLLSQWLTYPRAPNGYAIGLGAHHFSVAEEDGFTLLRCIYDSREQQRMAEAIAEVFVNYADDEKAGRGKREEREALYSKALIAAAAIKHHGFENEAEWRLVKTHFIGWGASKSVRYRQGRNGIVPYVLSPLATEGKKLKPARIHLGPSEDMNAARIALETFLDTQGFNQFLTPRVRIAESKTPYRP